MELDELKSAWADLARQLERRSALDLLQLKHAHFTRLRASLRPLYLTEVVSMLSGLGAIGMAALLWGQMPLPVHLIVVAAALHVYGVLCFVCAGIVFGRLQRVDAMAPVLSMQLQLARVRTAYVRTGLIVGLPWWFLWVAMFMAGSALGGVDLYERAPEFVWISLGVGVLGLAATFALYRWSRDPRRARFGQALDRVLIGGSLRRAQAWLDEVAAFERA
jgi:hypothetical protein